MNAMRGIVYRMPVTQVIGADHATVPGSQHRERERDREPDDHGGHREVEVLQPSAHDLIEVVGDPDPSDQRLGVLLAR